MACKTGSSVGTHANCLQVFCTFGTNLCAQSVQINKISASELSRKFIKTALLVGYVQSAQRIFFSRLSFLPPPFQERVGGEGGKELLFAFSGIIFPPPGNLSTSSSSSSSSFSIRECESPLFFLQGGMEWKKRGRGKTLCSEWVDKQKNKCICLRVRIEGTKWWRQIAWWLQP